MTNQRTTPLSPLPTTPTISLKIRAFGAIPTVQAFSLGPSTKLIPRIKKKTNHNLE
jgi:hypothetical protein